jgi:hypothetical protein
MTPLSRQRGATTVEVAIVGLVAMITLFGVLEVGRLLFVFNALEEATRRGARVAQVCQVNDPRIAEIAAFSNGGSSTIVGGLTPGNIRVEYLDPDGQALNDPMGSYAFINFVRVSITGYTHQFLVPLVARSFNTPAFPTTLYAESLGVSREGFSPC